MNRRQLLGLLLAGGVVAGAPTLTGCSAELDLVTAAVDRAPADARLEAGVLAGLSEFSGLMLDRFTEGSATGNVICSPLSIWIALAMTRNGARGRTAEEMDTALRYPALDRLNAGLNTLTQQLESRTGEVEIDGEKRELRIDLANQVFGQRGITWQQPFLEALARFYGSGIAQADFVEAPDRERRRINDWVAEVTEDKITDLIPAGLIRPNTRMVLVNAMYLAAPWATRFGEPVPGVFHAPDGDREADLIAVQLSARAARGDGWQAVEIPYAGEQVAMTVVLPDPGAEGAVHDALRTGLIGDVLAALDGPTGVELTMPTWSCRTAVALAETLQALGMRAAFTDADFSGMTGEADLIIDEVVHEGWIAVDRDGTEAAAATAVIMKESAAAPSELKIMLDRPFWYVIHDVPTGAPILVGRVADPSAEN